MSDVYSLLNINKDIFCDFHLLANRVADLQTERVFNRNKSKLRQIEERMLVDKGLAVAQQSIDEVISKVIRHVPSADTSSDNWSIRELRIVSYYLMKLRDNAMNYQYALDLLDRNWKNMFFNGLVFYLMNSWHNIEPEYREKTSRLLVKKLREYTDNNRRYILWKNHANLFESSGPMRMATMVIARKMNIKDAPTLLGFKASSIKQSYYSDVVIKYVSNNNITNRDEIEQILELNKLDRTKKLIFAYLVEAENQNGDGLRRAQLCRFASIQLGDVTLAASWAPFTGAADDDVQKLKHAMQLVNMWFTQQIIESFFEICVQDKERKKFWLNYVKDISGFKIIGSTAVKRLLQSNSKIGSMLFRHFKETNSVSSQTSALALFIRNKMIVEFSDTGALYVYNQNHPMVKLVTNPRNGITSTSDLKIPSMNMLIESDQWGRHYFSEEGRMTHQGYWSQRLSNWMNQIVLSSRNIGVSFMDSKYDDVFKAKPLPAENFKPQGVKRTEARKEKSNVVEAKDAADSSQLYETGISYKIASNAIDNGVRVVANNKGFYLSLKNNRYALIRPFNPNESLLGNIWIKKASLQGWKEIVHNYHGFQGLSTQSVGFIRITASEVVFKKELMVAGKTKYKLY